MHNHSVLIIDDHPLIAEVYESALKHVTKQNKNHQFNITIVNSCDTAIEAIKELQTLDLVFLDMSLPKSEDGKYLSGEDVGLELREQLPETKIIVSTTYNDNYRIYNILKNLNPEGFLIKNEFNRKDLVSSIEAVLKGKPAYSKTVLNLLQTQIKNSDYLVDRIDRDILHQLSIGTKTTDLEKVILLSKGGIASRKRRLKALFNIINGNDKQLVEIAKEKGFL